MSHCSFEGKLHSKSVGLIGLIGLFNKEFATEGPTLKIE